jgi:hypothetical protein
VASGPVSKGLVKLAGKLTSPPEVDRSEVAEQHEVDDKYVDSVPLVGDSNETPKTVQAEKLNAPKLAKRENDRGRSGDGKLVAPRVSVQKTTPRPKPGRV